MTYCSTAACPSSHTVAGRLEALGYTRVRRYSGGIDDWVEAGPPVESGGVLR